MVKDLKLVLTNPCSMQWDDLQQAGAGRYCDHCEKNIVDLTTKSDAELIQFFKSKEENVCGRLLSSQLNRKLELPSSKVNWQWLIPLTMGAIAITPAQAQQLKPAIVQDDQTSALSPPRVEAAGKLPELRYNITVNVIDDLSGKPLKGVNVRRKGFDNVVAITDSAGAFKLEIATKDMLLPYIFKLDGYSEKQISINQNMVVKLTAEQRIRLGGVSTMPMAQSPLYLVHAGDKNYTIDASRLRDIPVDWIEKIEVFKSEKETAIYGAKGAHGVVLLEIKKAYATKFNISQKE